ncbi:MAG TPA: DUF4340 domain-containing protein [Pirellulales bacterium]|nr:DUF4340 domain-containing protein [Pirellulales bacterium]
MNETGKTIGFVTAGIVAVAVGIYSHLGPAESELSKQQLVGKSLFGELKPEAAKSLEIIEYDPDKLELKPFKVAQENGIWRIPSHEDYPADASQQLGEAAVALVACETINIESDDPGTHATYGVIDPDPKSLTAGTTGVGKRVTLEDASGKKLAQLIIGKAVKGQTELHYVRKDDKDRVYVVKLKTDKFSTKFEDWIEKDLLKLSSWDIQEVAFNDYSIDELQGAVIPRAKIEVGFDSKDSKWKLEELEVFRSGEYHPEELADDEELNTQKLNDLKNALDDLKIVDVRRKPEGLAADLRAGDELSRNDEAKTSLMQRGFYLARIEDGGPLELYSNEGEVRCGTKEGVEYTLRFGRIASTSDSEASSDEASKEGDEASGADEADDKKGTGANRFIMVTAQFNEDLLARPELTPLPGEKPNAESKPEEEKKDDVEKTSAAERNVDDAAAQLALADDEQADDDQPADEAAADEKPAKQEKKAAKSEKGKSDADDLQKPKTPEQLERDRITKENERKQKEYDDKVKKGKEKVKELSDRFSDWYYVVSDSTYHKIHLGRDEIVKKKTPPADDKKPEGHDHEHEEDSKNILSDEDKAPLGE